MLEKWKNTPKAVVQITLQDTTSRGPQQAPSKISRKRFTRLCTFTSSLSQRLVLNGYDELTSIIDDLWACREVHRFTTNSTVSETRASARKELATRFTLSDSWDQASHRSYFFAKHQAFQNSVKEDILMIYFCINSLTPFLLLPINTMAPKFSGTRERITF